MNGLTRILDTLFTDNGELLQIVGVTLRAAFTSTGLSFLIGAPLGVAIGMNSFRFKRALLSITGTLTGLPPVLAGLVVFFLLSRSGPLGQFKLLYSVAAMVTAQVLLITPIVIHMAATVVGVRLEQVNETLRGAGISRIGALKYMLLETRSQLASILFMGFGRAISEVGAAQLVGGNVQYKTRVMTTAIVLETNKGDFELALALGILLLLISLIINTAGRLLQRERP